MRRTVESILQTLKAQANPDNVAGMARYGINPEGTLGVSVPALRQMAKEIGKDHELALELWASGLHEARILAVYIDDPRQVSETQMESWVVEIDSWDVCDQACSNLFDRTPYGVQKAFEWSERQETFVKRAGFVLMAALAVHDKKLPDETFEAFLAVITHQGDDERNFVKKAVNWALRQIGKRNLPLNRAAIAVAERLELSPSRAARWVAADALRELKSSKVQDRLNNRRLE
jgi:3-methyladenine DNA glycosylase AlkD